MPERPRTHLGRCALKNWSGKVPESTFMVKVIAILLRRTSTGKQFTGKCVFLVFLRPTIVVRGGVRPMAVYPGGRWPIN